LRESTTSKSLHRARRKRIIEEEREKP